MSFQRPLPSANVLFLCRLCGTETLALYRLNIFDNTGIALDIKTKITNCLGFDISIGDYLPKVLCTSCVENIIRFDEFKRKCNETALYLIDLLTKQMLVGNKNYPKQIDQKQITNNLKSINFNPSIHSKSKNNAVLRSNPSFSVPIPSSSNAHKLPINNMKKMVFQCNICKDVFTTHEESIEHVNTVHNTSNQDKIKSDNSKRRKKKNIMSKYECAQCPYICDARKKIRNHLRIHSDIRFYCKVCNKKLKSKKCLNVHMKIHSKVYDHVCNHCGKGFIGKTQLDYHVRTLHTKELPFQCNKCERKFATKGHLKYHEQTIHNDEYNFTCEICNKSFKTQYCLNGHKKIHIPKEERVKFKCSMCDQSFIKRGYLKRHILGHTGELNYGCTMCDKRYKDKLGLKVHLLTHTGEKNHVCDVCGKAFALKSGLIIHVRTHTKERPFKCNVCQNTFTHKSSLNMHLKKSCSTQNK